MFFCIVFIRHFITILEVEVTVRDIPKIIFEELKGHYNNNACIIGYEEKGDFTYLNIRNPGSRNNFCQTLFSLKAGPHKCGETISESSTANLGHPLYKLVQCVRTRACELLDRVQKPWFEREKERWPQIKLLLFWIEQIDES